MTPLKLSTARGRNRKTRIESSGLFLISLKHLIQVKQDMINNLDQDFHTRKSKEGV